jgi:hypothetical protein
MSRDVYGCSHWPRPRNPPSPAFGLICEGRYWSAEIDESPCNPLAKFEYFKPKSVPSNEHRWLFKFLWWLVLKRVKCKVLLASMKQPTYSENPNCSHFQTVCSDFQIATCGFQNWCESRNLSRKPPMTCTFFLYPIRSGQWTLEKIQNGNLMQQSL